MDIFNNLLNIVKNSHSVYSNYSVASIAIDENNLQYPGVNVENASYGLTICAERNAIARAITDGSKKIKEIHILCTKHTKTFGTPCGACRQVFAEFMENNGKIIIYNNIGEKKIFTVDELLPLTFRQEYFNKE